MTPDEFINAGLLVDLCRHWGHPRGLDAVLVTPQPKEAGPNVVVKLVDYTNAPGGVMGVNDDHPAAAIKLARARRWFERRAERRIREMGALYEPVAGVEDDVIALRYRKVDADALDERIGALAGLLAADALHALSVAEGDSPLPEVLKQWFAEAVVAKVTQGIGHVLSRIRVAHNGAFFLATSPLDLSEADKADGVRGRIRFLTTAILEEKERQEKRGEVFSLLPAELDEAMGLGVKMAALLLCMQDDELLASDEAITGLNRLSELWDLAQPGMRFFRNDADGYHKNIEGLRAWAKATISNILQSRTDIENVLNGDLDPTSIRDQSMCVSLVDERLAVLDQVRADMSAVIIGNEREAKRLRAAKDAILASAVP